MEEALLSQQLKRLKIEEEENELFDTEESSHNFPLQIPHSKTDDTYIKHTSAQVPQIPGSSTSISADVLPFKFIAQERTTKFNLGARLKRIDKKQSDKKEACFRLKQNVKKSRLSSQQSETYIN